MSASIIDQPLILQTYLRQTATDLYTEIVARTYHNPPGLPRDMTRQDALSFQILPGMGPDTPALVEHIEVQFSCWGPTPKQAWAVLIALESTLHNTSGEVTISGSTYRISSARRISSGQYIRDPKPAGGLHRVLTTYRILILNRTTAAGG